MITGVTGLNREASNKRKPNYCDLRAGTLVESSVFSAIRRRMLLEGCKWDPQVGDCDTLSPFPLILKSSVWKQLSSQAETLAVEAAEAELEIVQKPELLAQLGLPPNLRRVLGAQTPLTPSAARVIRFDFHPSKDGWRISEANSDVPGGFTEASMFTSLVADQFSGLFAAGNPGLMWADALTEKIPQGGVVALVSASGYMEDHQVIAFQASQLAERGFRAILASLNQIRWVDGAAHLETQSYRGRVDAIIRFYQAEWIARQPRETGWANFFRGGKTPVANPSLSVISESKRFPLVWDKLSAALPTWRKLLPETCDPRRCAWQRDGSWLLKTAMCNTGDTVSMRERMTPWNWLRVRLAVLRSPSNWVAQRRFESLPIATPQGLRHVCLGVYTINGRSAGIYARMSPKPLIDFSATDIALLIEDDD